VLTQSVVWSQYKTPAQLLHFKKHVPYICWAAPYPRREVALPYFNLQVSDRNSACAITKTTIIGTNNFQIQRTMNRANQRTLETPMMQQLILLPSLMAPPLIFCSKCLNSLLLSIRSCSNSIVYLTSHQP
jgi:hypothetical protein